jgi:hypothetical protein
VHIIIDIMKSRQSIIKISILISFSLSIVISFLITYKNTIQTNSNCSIDCNGNIGLSSIINPMNLTKHLISSTVDPKYDTQLISLDKSVQMPEIHGYHDIISTQISKIYGNKLLLAINLDDDPNKNKKYETTYLWLISHIDPLNHRNQIYTIIIPNFGSDSNFQAEGWYLAIYDNVNTKYILPLSKLDKMTNNRVEIAIDPIFIGNNLDFNYTTAIMIRVNDTFLAKPPDFLVDSSPNDNDFWSKWFL